MGGEFRSVLAADEVGDVTEWLQLARINVSRIVAVRAMRLYFIRLPQMARFT